MKILFITNNYTPYSGGVVSSINSSVDYLHAHGHNVRIVTLQFLDTHRDPEYVVRIGSLHNWQYKNIYFTVPHLYQAIVDQQIKEYAPDIIHVHHPFLLAKAAIASRHADTIPIIFTHHTQYHHYAHYTGVLSPITRRVVRHIVARFCSKVTHVIAPSSGVRDYLRLDGVTTPITVLPSALQDCFLPPAQLPIHSKVHTPIRLLYVGRLVKEKNIPFLFDALLHLSIPFTLTIVGYGQEEEYLQQLAYKDYGFSKEQVVFVAKQKSEKLVEYYRNADLFLFPSSSDTQGLVLAESMAQGRPVIAVSGMGQKDSIVQGKNGFIVSDVRAMVHKIMMIARDDLLFARLQRGAWQSAHEYNPEIIGKRLVRVYTALVKK